MTSYPILASRIILKYTDALKKNAASLRRRPISVSLHRLRVNSRRLRNAFWIFKDLIPKRRRKKWNRSLRDLARTTSLARDQDVHIKFLYQYLSSLKPGTEKSAVGQKIQHLKQERGQIQARLRKAIEVFHKQDTLKAVSMSLSEDRRTQPTHDLMKIDSIGLGQRRIQKRLNAFKSYEVYVSRPECVEELHHMRIAAKHLRYTMEGLRPVYGKRIDPYIQTVLGFHRILGALHDLDVWIGLLSRPEVSSEHSIDYKEAMIKLREYCCNKRGVIYNQFLTMWKRVKQRKILEKLTIEIENAGDKK